MMLFNELKQELYSYLSQEQVHTVYKAYRLARAAHKGQRRHSGEDYISHPVAVAQILAEMRLDHTTIIAALLHDVIEDTPLDKARIAKHFGDAVAHLVDGVSKLDQIEFGSRAEAQAENFRKMVFAMANDIRVIIVKLADRLHNMRTINACSHEKRRRIAAETLEIFAPIANRVGMHNIRVELENRGFAALHPLRYRILTNALRKISGNRKEILIDIENSLKESLLKHGLPADSVWGREKHLYSIYKKMRSKKLHFAEVMDVYAFRIVVDNIDTCYRALGIVHNLYKPVPERFKDYIAIPKANGYQSLHTTLFGPYGVPIEIQIRDHDMEELANNGIAAHWIYKSKTQIFNSAQVRARNWLKTLMEMQKKAGSPLEFIEHVKFDLFPDEVYVFTPKGDIMELPNGGTPVDFAYAIHSDIGNSCVAAKIDRRLAPLSTPLMNGQHVEIITSSNAQPNPIWLNFVVTGKARGNIRHFLKTQRQTESIAFGKRLLDRDLAVLDIQWKTISPERIDALLQEYRYSKLDKLFESIGLGNKMAPLVAAKLAQQTRDDKQPLPITPLSIKGTEGMVVNFATCCYPIPGDAIIGLLQQDRGIIVHNDICGQIQKLRGRASNTLDLRWETSIDDLFRSALDILVINDRGTLSRLTTTIATMNADIEDIHIHQQDDRHRTVRLILKVRHRTHLARIIRALRINKTIFRITRTSGPIRYSRKG